jgi:ribosomal protein S27AE
MTTPTKTKRATCPYCGKRVGLTKLGKLYPHKDPETRNRCGRSGGRPN